MTVAIIRDGDQLRKVRSRDRFVLFFVIDVDVVESNKIEKVRVIDHTEAEEFADAWLGNAVLELGQPAI